MSAPEPALPLSRRGFLLSSAALLLVAPAAAEAEPRPRRRPLPPPGPRRPVFEPGVFEAGVFA